MEQLQLARATELFLGMVTGIVADGQLNDQEVMFLRHWLLNHEELSVRWPGSVITARIRAALEDGFIDEAERQHMLDTFRLVAVTDFASTGSAESQAIALPFDMKVPIIMAGCKVVFTGKFVYGTRAACEKRAIVAGAIPLSNMRSDVRYLIVGATVSESWQHASYGRKIQAAVEMQLRGSKVAIVSEQRWIDALDDS